MTIRIPLEDVDMTGCMYHGNYLKYYDRARTDFLLTLGFSHHHMIQNRSFFVVKKAEQEFLKPLHLESLITLNTWVQKVGGTSIGFCHSLNQDHHTLSTCHLVMVHVDATFKPAPLPLTLKECLKSYIPS